MTSRRGARVLLGGVIGAQLAYPQLSPRAQRRATGPIVAGLTAAAVASLTARRGRRGALRLAGAAAAIGTAAEVLGTRTGRPFGPYAYGRGLGPAVGGLPLGVPAAWVMMAPAAWSTAGTLTASAPRRVLLAAGCLTAWDVALDPRMVREGFWRWERPGRYEGIPLSNFLGWGLTAGCLFTAWAVLDPDGRAADEDLVLYGWTWVGEVVANVLFWRRPRVAAASGLAMGAFAVPALRARTRRA